MSSYRAAEAHILRGGVKSFNYCQLVHHSIELHDAISEVYYDMPDVGLPLYAAAKS
jgi:hypothetical protein